jgi:hypothetical protein
MYQDALNLKEHFISNGRNLPVLYSAEDLAKIPSEAIDFLPA